MAVRHVISGKGLGGGEAEVPASRGEVKNSDAARPGPPGLQLVCSLGWLFGSALDGSEHTTTPQRRRATPRKGRAWREEKKEG